MENKVVDKFTRVFSVEIPFRESLDEYLELILPEVYTWGEDLIETKFFSQHGGKPWLEVTDNELAQEMVLHFFNQGGEYIKSVDGNISKGTWRLLPGTNKFILEQGVGAAPKAELYELSFLDTNFFILRKHGDQMRKGQRKYFAMGWEPMVRGLEWRDYVELLFNTYRQKSKTYQMIIILAVILAILIGYYSIS